MISTLGDAEAWLLHNHPYLGSPFSYPSTWPAVTTFQSSNGRFSPLGSPVRYARQLGSPAPPFLCLMAS